jgi:protein MpaA
MIAFLKDVKPRRILSFHQPLYGVDTDTKNQKFARRVADVLELPAKTFDCGGVCHGTMTSWYNHRFKGAALTVEYGSSPSNTMMRKTAPKRVLKVFGARRVQLESELVS